ncbi:hypothetical protein [Pleurocapsa sp. PCC 7327]|nr:hypothetical protein [Pleurocapsa sp. PCC 7327]
MQFLPNVCKFEQINEPEVIARASTMPSFLQMLGMMGADPFYAVLAKRL